MLSFQKLLHKLNGLHYSQEYLCLAKEPFQQSLHVFLVSGNRIVKDITHSHLFVGYQPLILALYSSASDKQSLPDAIDIIFSQLRLQPNEFVEKRTAIAFLSLRMIRRQLAPGIEIIYYEGVKGEHRFLSSLHQYIIGLNNRLYNKKPGNIYLHNKLYKQVQIAYAIPRTISLITVYGGDLYNLFPTDLHGPVNEQYYISSLRHEGKACRQVERAGRIVVSEMHCDAYKTVYLLGKNHAQELKTKDNFPFGDDRSLIFHLPLPQSALYCRELELLDSFNHGIHKLLLYKIVSAQALRKEPSTLAHIHTTYATWRHNNGLAGKYLLR